MSVHPTAVVDPAAHLGEGVEIGPYCVVGPHARLGDGVQLHSHVVVDGHTTLGAGCVLYPFACVGLPPQDRKYGGRPTELRVGPRTIIREQATLHVGTEGGGGLTRVGADCLLMVATHVAHDCQLGDRVVLANGASLGGHVEIGDDTSLGGLTGVHQFVRIGRQAFVGGATALRQDVIPFGVASGPEGALTGLNLVGLRRRGTPREDIDALQTAFQRVFRENGVPIARRISTVAEALGEHPLVAELLAFAGTRSPRGLSLPAERG